ncbi:MAG: glycosyltransferase, partial [Pseudomonadota bacterium]
MSSGLLASLRQKPKIGVFMQHESDITVVVTSCNRHDLLARTLESFRQHESEGRVARILVAEDGDADPADVCQRFGAEYFRTNERVGQIRLIDQAYARVQTPYIFHLEDDWEFYRSGFMQKSREVLQSDSKILLVQLRAWNDTNGHPVSHATPDRSFGVMATGYCDCWHGFTFNPGLRRLSDYQLLGGSYEKQPRTMYVVAKTPTAALPFEVEASAFYHRLGYRAMILDEPFRFVSEGYRERVALLLEDLATEIGIQFILVTHDPEFK